MHPINDYVTIRRGQEELRRRAEYERMIRQAKLKQWNQTLINWLGTHLVRLGQKLESFGKLEKTLPSPSPSPHH